MKNFIFTRGGTNKTFIIVLNFSDDKVQWDIHNFDSMRLVISNYKKLYILNQLIPGRREFISAK